jgi:hypothetical protein
VKTGYLNSSMGLWALSLHPCLHTHQISGQPGTTRLKLDVATCGGPPSPLGTHGSHGCGTGEIEKITSETLRSGAVRPLLALCLMLELRRIHSSTPPSDPLLLRWILPLKLSAPFSLPPTAPFIRAPPQHEKDEGRRGVGRRV